jgi:deoxyribonuclease V
MIACLDVHYHRNMASAAAVIFEEWADTAPANHYSVSVECNSAYEPGKFYLRELKPLMAVIEQIKKPVNIYVIDAYCYLSADHEPGLGAYLYKAIHGRPRIIGVAKNRFRRSEHAITVFRGKSKRPLYITSIEMSPEEAGSCISAMSGAYRIPALLRITDQLARGR